MQLQLKLELSLATNNNNINSKQQNNNIYNSYQNKNNNNKTISCSCDTIEINLVLKTQFLSIFQWSVGPRLLCQIIYKRFREFHWCEKACNGDVEIGQDLPRDGCRTLSNEGRTKNLNERYFKIRESLNEDPKQSARVDQIFQLFGLYPPRRIMPSLTYKYAKAFCKKCSDSRHRVSIPHGRNFDRKMASLSPLVMASVRPVRFCVVRQCWAAVTKLIRRVRKNMSL